MFIILRRMIEKRLLDQYRQDPEKREEFIRTALGKEAANEPPAQKVQKKPKVRYIML